MHNFTSNFVFNPISRPLQSWKDEILNTAEHIRLSTTRDLVLCLSGGIDSEVVAKAFIEKGIEFTALSLRYGSKRNIHDIEYAEEFCKKNNIKHQLIDVDIVDFIQNKVELYIEQGYYATEVFRYLQLYLLETVESMGKCAILGGGEQIYSVCNNVIGIEYSDNFQVSLDWIKNHNTDHVPYFYMATPEVYAAYMQVDLVKVLHADPRYFATPQTKGISLEKVMIYHANWDIPRRRKFHGFEKVFEMLKTKEERLQQRFPTVQPSCYPVAVIKQQLGI